MRILLITRNLPPLVGGMERLNWHMADELSHVADVHVIGPAGAAALRPPAVEVTEVPLQPLGRFLAVSAWQAVRTARRFRPDLVVAGSGLTAPIVYCAAKVVGARTAVYVHGLDVALHHPVYRAVWLPAIRRMGHVIANSTPTAKRCHDIGITDDRIGVVHPGVELPREESIAPARIEAADFREREGLKGRALLLSVGRLSTRKGMREFVSEALPCIVAMRSDAMLLIVGDAPVQALHAETQTRASIQAAADAAGVGGHVRFLGAITDAELRAVYSAADVHVFPVRSTPNDPEGFGMVAIEAAAHGLPTVAFASGGVVDAVSEGRSGKLLPRGDYMGMAQAVCEVLAERSGWGARASDFARDFSWEAFGEKLVAQLRLSSCNEAHDGGG